MLAISRKLLSGPLTSKTDRSNAHWQHVCTNSPAEGILLGPGPCKGVGSVERCPGSTGPVLGIRGLLGTNHAPSRYVSLQRGPVPGPGPAAKAAAAAADVLICTSPLLAFAQPHHSFGCQCIKIVHHMRKGHPARAGGAPHQAHPDGGRRHRAGRAARVGGLAVQRHRHHWCCSAIQHSLNNCPMQPD